MYFKPRSYRCHKCGNDFMWSEQGDIINLGKPFCTVFYVNFIRNNVPIGELKE